MYNAEEFFFYYFLGGRVLTTLFNKNSICQIFVIENNSTINDLILCTFTIICLVKELFTKPLHNFDMN